MALHDGFDPVAFEDHLNVIYHNRPTDIAPLGLDLFGPPQSGPVQLIGEAGDHASQKDSATAGDARARLTQEALFTSPTAYIAKGGNLQYDDDKAIQFYFFNAYA
jgi:hypothetical protein